MNRQLHISTTPTQKSREDSTSPGADSSPLTNLTDSSSDSPPVSRRLFSDPEDVFVKNADEAAYRDHLIMSSEANPDETPDRRGTPWNLRGLEKRLDQLLQVNAVMHKAFDDKKFFLLPEEKEVQAMRKLYQSKQKVHPSTNYPVVRVYKYELVVNKELVQLPITRLADPLPPNDEAGLDPGLVHVHLFPFDGMDILETTVRPYFVICHIGLLLDPEGDGVSSDLAASFLYANHNLHLQKRIIQCLELWRIWRNSMPTNEFFNTPKKAGTGGQRSNVTSLRRASSTGKRTRSGVRFKDMEESPEQVPKKKKSRTTIGASSS
ncbi:hypothetical protein C0995_000309 [Termitomyces sp. Mi166|nr:hypothetical protein C0995_000309 [Termitomyces sp. Mi166\